MEKKKILIVFTGAMELGGIERSLLGLLETLDYVKYDIDLFLYGHHGALYSLIDKRANLLPEVKELAYLRESFSEKIKNGCYYSAAFRLKDAFCSHFRKIDYDKTWERIMDKCAPELAKEYDLALGFFLPFDFIKTKVHAKVKVGWIHTDYKNEPSDHSALLRQYEGMDWIAAVSEQCKQSFIEVFPQFANKTIVIENILSDKFIYEKSNESDVSSEIKEPDIISILSVGRFCSQKNFDNVPFICKKIRGLGLNVKWYLIGLGPDEELIRKKIEEAGMQECVIILGKKENPYPYVKACDIYVQPSRYEGKCVAVREAQILEKPVIITNYETSVNQLKDGYDGVIVSMDNEKCAQEIAEVIQNKVLQQKIVENQRKNDYTNKEEVQKLYALIK